jgi:hypothetical protein
MPDRDDVNPLTSSLMSDICYQPLVRYMRLALWWCERENFTFSLFLLCDVITKNPTLCLLHACHHVATRAIALPHTLAVSGQHGMFVLSTPRMHLVALFCHCPLLHARSALLLAQVCQYLYVCTSKASKVSTCCRNSARLCAARWPLSN